MRLFGACATGGEGVAQATSGFPLAVDAVTGSASTRERPCADERFLSAHVSWGASMPIRKDKNNYKRIIGGRPGRMHWWKIVDGMPEMA